MQNLIFIEKLKTYIKLREFLKTNEIIQEDTQMDENNIEKKLNSFKESTRKINRKKKQFDITSDKDNIEDQLNSFKENEENTQEEF